MSNQDVDEVHCLTLEAFPERRADEFEVYVVAIVVCWIRAVDAAEAGGVETLAEAKLADHGWRVAFFVQDKLVTAADYSPGDEGEPFIAQARTDGFVASFNSVSRECFGDQEHVEESVAAVLDVFAGRIRETGYAWCLWSDVDDQVANGCTPNGNDFLPLWSDRPNSEWLTDWPDCTPRQLSLTGLWDVLANAVDGELVVAIGYHPYSYVTTHPASVREWIEEHEPSRQG